VPAKLTGQPHRFRRGRREDIFHPGCFREHRHGRAGDQPGHQQKQNDLPPWAAIDKWASSHEREQKSREQGNDRQEENLFFMKHFWRQLPLRNGLDTHRINPLPQAGRGVKTDSIPPSHPAHPSAKSRHWYCVLAIIRRLVY
jgi:hypothetical protein